MKDLKEITHFLDGKGIMYANHKERLAEEYGIREPSHVVLERKPEGILIRKLEI